MAVFTACKKTVVMPDKGLMMREFSQINEGLQQVKQKKSEIIEDLLKVLGDHRAIDQPSRRVVSMSEC